MTLRKLRRFSALIAVSLAFGCDPSADRAITNLNHDVGRLARENGALKARVEKLEADSAEYQKREMLIAKAILGLQKATETTASAPRQAASAEPSPAESHAELARAMQGLMDAVNRETAEPPAGPKIMIVGDSSTRSTVSSHCQQQWPSDFHMQAFCQQQQDDARSKLAQRDATNSGVGVGDFNVIRASCRQQWPDDYHMQNFCEEQQAQSWKQTHR